MALLDSQSGRDIVQALACHVAKGRMSRRLKRAFFIAFDAWKNTSEFSLETFLNELNLTDQTEITQINQLLIQLGCGSAVITTPANGGIFWVDPINGSDETGDGSSTRPFQSLEFMSGPFFPRYIDHKYIVAIKSDVSADAISLDQEIGPNGSLSIVGNGDPTVVTTSQGAGPFTVTGVVPLGFPIAGYEIQVAETFGVDELYGKWLLLKTGGNAGTAVQIHRNTASSLFIREGTNIPVATDTFQVVTPSVSINCPRWDMQLKGPTHGDANSALSRFNLFNLNIDVSSASVKWENFRLRNSVDTQIAFVTFTSAADQFEHCQIESNLNGSDPYDPNAGLSATLQVANFNHVTGGVDNAGLLVYRTGFPPATFGFDDVQIRHAAMVKSVDTAGRMNVLANFGEIRNCAIGQLRFENGASGGIYKDYISGDSAGPAVEVLFGGSLDIQANYLESGQDAFEIIQARLTVNQNTHGTFSGYGFRFGQRTAYVCTQMDPSGWVGTTGAIYFAGGVGVTAFPAANARATDAIANFFARIDTP